MVGVGAALAGIGIDFVKDLIMDNGEDLVKEGIKKVTGIDLNSKPPKELSSDDIVKIKKAEAELRTLDYDKLALRLKDKDSARKTSIQRQGAADWLVRNTGSMLAIATIVFAFTLDIYILVEAFTSYGMTDLNPVVTLIAGYSSARAIQVLSFYFGESKASADDKRK